MLPYSVPVSMGSHAAGPPGDPIPDKGVAEETASGRV